jgi:hypothetical protein
VVLAGIKLFEKGVLATKLLVVGGHVGKKRRDLGDDESHNRKRACGPGLVGGQRKRAEHRRGVGFKDGPTGGGAKVEGEAGVLKHKLRPPHGSEAQGEADGIPVANKGVQRKVVHVDSEPDRAGQIGTIKVHVGSGWGGDSVSLVSAVGWFVPLLRNSLLRDLGGR